MMVICRYPVMKARTYSNNVMPAKGHAFLAVMLLLMMGILLLTALHRYLDFILHTTIDARYYRRNEQLAFSALEWGRVQRWPISELERLEGDWYCLSHEIQHFSACIAPGEGANTIWLRGQALNTLRPNPLRLYQLIRMEREVSADTWRLVLQSGGWSDFCALSRKALCEEE